MVRLKGKRLLLEKLIQHVVDPIDSEKTKVYFYGDFIHVTHPDMKEQDLEYLFEGIRKVKS